MQGLKWGLEVMNRTIGTYAAKGYGVSPYASIGVDQSLSGGVENMVMWATAVALAPSYGAAVLPDTIALCRTQAMLAEAAVLSSQSAPPEVSSDDLGIPVYPYFNGLTRDF